LARNAGSTTGRRFSMSFADQMPLRRMRNRTFVSAFAWVLLAAAALVADPASAQDTDPFMRQPAISPDGETVAFSYQGDVWTVAAGGGRAVRLTVHEAYDGHPYWGPDGRRIGFVSDRYGNDDVFVMSADGSTPERLTHHSTDDGLSGWTPDGRLLFDTRRTFAQAEWGQEIYSVDASGGTPDRLLDAVGYAPAMSPDGRFVALERGANATDKKGYEGPADKDVWVYDTENDAYRQLTGFEGNDYKPTWGGPRTLYYVSEQDGTYNLYRQRLAEDGTAEGEAEPLTNFDGAGVRTFSVGGGRVAFERQTDVYVMNAEAGAEPRPLDVSVPADYRFDPVETKAYDSNVRNYAVSPNGDQVAMVIRGEIFLREAGEDETRTVQLTDHAYRDRDVQWLSDSTLAFTSDRNGQYDIYRLESADPEHTDLYEALQHRVVRLTETEADERNLVVSPDREKIAFRRGAANYMEGELITAALEGGDLAGETVLLDSWSIPSDYTWSPDGKWLAYSRSDLDFNAEVYIHAADGSREPVNVSQHPRGDGSPIWGPQGDKLAFVSERSGNDYDVWFTWLQEEDWEKTRRDWEEAEGDEGAGDEGAADDAAEEEAEAVQIDFEDIHARVERVTAVPGNEAEPVVGTDGERFYFVAGRDGRTTDYDTDVDLYSIKWDGSDRQRLTEGGLSPRSVRLGADGESLFFLHSDGRVAQLAVADASLTRLAFQASMEVDHEEEQKQIFREAWRAIDQAFYDPNFHGSNWDSLRTVYRPMAMNASTTRDFQAVINRMLGELNASHMGFYTGDRAETQSDRTGRLGVELDPVDAGVEVQRVVPRSPADREASTLRVGDVITAVNGESVAEAGNVYALLNGTVDEKVLLSVTGADGEERTVRIRPTGDLEEELYREWVENRKTLTEEYSDGRLGYVHVEGMNWESFEHFERELYASAHDKEGLIIDVRYNGGGWTTDYLLTVLNVRRHAYTVPRGAAPNLEASHADFRGHYPFGERLPYAQWTKPVAALCNQNSYSNAEIFSHAFKNLDHGPLIGQPTFGAVISTGGVGLLDGSYIRMPFRGWYVYQTDQNMEHGPAVPDITVENPPASKAEGTDPQLRRAVDEMLRRVDAEGTATSKADAQ
jgi:tricorn protease